MSIFVLILVGLCGFCIGCGIFVTMDRGRAARSEEKKPEPESER